MVLEGGVGQWYAAALLQSAAAQHFFSYGILRKEEWVRVFREHGAAQEEGAALMNEGLPENDALMNVRLPEGGAQKSQNAPYSASPSQNSEQIWARYQLDSAGAMLVVALRYAPDVEPESDEERAARGLAPLPVAKQGRPVAAVGRFARANWYRETIARLADCVKSISDEARARGLPVFSPREWHRFSNSRFPEKALAVAAGLGTIGRNGLLIARRTGNAESQDSRCTEISSWPKWSSAVVLGLVLLPFDIGMEAGTLHDEPIMPLALCGTCQRCVDACPTGALALAELPRYERARCIQNYTSGTGLLPEDIQSAWGNQLYGCDICLEACPYFKPDSEASSTLGRIGGAFDAAFIAAMSDTDLRAVFKGSALDQKWIEPEALKRNAAFAAGQLAGRSFDLQPRLL